jgi:hypothetical protein
MKAYPENILSSEIFRGCNHEIFRGCSLLKHGGNHEIFRGCKAILNHEIFTGFKNNHTYVRESCCGGLPE